MQPNGLDIKAINPKNGQKYSPNLYKFMTDPQRRGSATYTMIYRDHQGVLWLGIRDEEGWFHGARLIAVLCSGRKETVFAHPPVFGKALTEVKGFWKRYVSDGRCEIDKAHDMYFVGDKDRWSVKGDHRTCTWCGKVRQKKERYVEKVRKERWVKT
jgi:hypothetical protein